MTPKAGSPFGLPSGFLDTEDLHKYREEYSNNGRPFQPTSSAYGSPGGLRPPAGLRRRTVYSAMSCTKDIIKVIHKR